MVAVAQKLPAAIVRIVAEMQYLCTLSGNMSVREAGGVLRLRALIDGMISVRRWLIGRLIASEE